MVRLTAFWEQVSTQWQTSGLMVRGDVKLALLYAGPHYSILPVPHDDLSLRVTLLAPSHPVPFWKSKASVLQNPGIMRNLPSLRRPFNFFLNLLVMKKDAQLFFFWFHHIFGGAGEYVSSTFCVLKEQALHSKRIKHVLSLWGRDCWSWTFFLIPWAISAMGTRHN